MSTDQTRRKFLLTAVSLVCGHPAASASIGYGSRQALTIDQRVQNVESVLGPLQSIAVVGLKVNNEMDGFMPAEWEVGFIDSIWRMEKGLTEIEVKELKDAYHGRVSTDFNNSNTYLIEGWCLSRTEICVARLVVDRAQTTGLLTIQ
ncbi:MAG: hypothetical protein ACWA5Q_03800 [bacterium]